MSSREDKRRLDRLAARGDARARERQKATEKARERQERLERMSASAREIADEETGKLPSRMGPENHPLYYQAGEQPYKNSRGKWDWVEEWEVCWHCANDLEYDLYVIDYVVHVNGPSVTCEYCMVEIESAHPDQEEDDEYAGYPDSDDGDDE